MRSSMHNSRKARSRGRRGFTLVELIAAIVVIGAIGSAASSMLVSSIDGYFQAATQAQLHTELSITIDRIDREFRRIEREVSATIAPNITAATSTSLTWNGNNTLSRSGSQLMLSEGGATPRVLLDDVIAFGIQTYDQSNAALPLTLNDGQADAVRRIRVSITIQRNGVSETLSAKMFVRCTMEGA